MKNEFKCILAIVNNGFAEQAMEAAKACGYELTACPCN